MSDELSTPWEGRGIARPGAIRVVSFRGKDVSHRRSAGSSMPSTCWTAPFDRRNPARVSAQLIDVTKGNEVWSEEYDRDTRDRDVFAVQDEIARAIVAALRVHLSGPASAALAKRSTRSPEAHDLYLRVATSTRGVTLPASRRHRTILARRFRKTHPTRWRGRG